MKSSNNIELIVQKKALEEALNEQERNVFQFLIDKLSTYEKAMKLEKGDKLRHIKTGKEVIFVESSQIGFGNGFIKVETEEDIDHVHLTDYEKVIENKDLSQNEPYLRTVKIRENMEYNPDYGDKRICICGDPYHRHFDSYEDMAAIGCKYCPCVHFVEKTDKKKVVQQMWMIHDTLFLEKEKALLFDDGKETMKEVFVGVDEGESLNPNGEMTGKFASWIYSNEEVAQSEVDEFNKM